MNKYNPFHLVDNSPWPILTSLNFLSFGLGVVVMVHTYNWAVFISSILLFCVASYLWGADIHRESCMQGLHTEQVTKGLKTGMILFILSECFFFLGMFWSYLHLAESPAVELGGLWPPVGVEPFDPKGIPFMNTILLVSSGVSVTWTHHAMEKGEYKNAVLSLAMTVTLGVIFTSLQILEYYVASFTFSCSSYSSVYFMGTGFHGTHVLIGTILLTMCLSRFSTLSVSPTHSVGFECSVWYWHFVDIVWFCLYLIFYWWGI